MLTNARREAAQSLAQTLRAEIGHLRHVAGLSEKLFRAFQPLHGLDEDALELLCCGAWLHDIGVTVEARSHHKHSLRLVLESDLPGFTARERWIVANIARYHRKALPTPSHEAYAALAGEDQKLVCRLAALVRIADGLDRAHQEAVTEVQASQPSPDEWRLTFSGPGDMDLALWGAERKSDLFEAVYGVRLHLAVE